MNNRSEDILLVEDEPADADLTLMAISGTNSYSQKPVDFQKFEETVRNFGTYWLCVHQPPPLGAFVESDSGAKP